MADHPSPAEDALPDRQGGWDPEQITPEVVHGWLDASLRSVIGEGLAATGADEGTLWIVELSAEELVPVCSTSPRAEEFVLRHRQSLASGIVSMVCVSEQPFADVEVFRDARQDASLDERLGLRTWAMAVVPFYLGGSCHGVLSAVQLMSGDAEEDPRKGFDNAALGKLQSLAEEAGQRLASNLATDPPPTAI